MEREDGDEEKDEELHGGGDPVGDEGGHAPEDDAGHDDGRDDGGEARLGQYDVGGGAGGVRRALHGHAHVGPLQRGGVVHAVARHARLW